VGTVQKTRFSPSSQNGLVTCARLFRTFSHVPTSSSCDVPLFPARVFGTCTDMSAPANAFEAPPKVELTKDQAKGTSK